MEKISRNDTLDLDALESRLEMESVAALSTDIVSSLACNCSIFTNPKPS